MCLPCTSRKSAIAALPWHHPHSRLPPPEPLVRLEGCGHGTSSQRPREWGEEVLRFLRDVDAGAPLGEDEVR